MITHVGHDHRHTLTQRFLDLILRSQDSQAKAYAT
jgi:hypothetical protein